MSASYILGVDPGKTGAFCVIEPNMDQIVSLWDTPLKETSTGKKEIDLTVLSTQLAVFAGEISHAIIEQVNSMPHDGHVGAFNFGKATGIAMGMISMMFIPIFQVPPAVWKANMGLTGMPKEASRDLATKFFPFSKHLWSYKKDHGRAEAALLAQYGKRFSGGPTK